MNEVKMKPCPFCGGRLKIMRETRFSTEMATVQCQNDQCILGPSMLPPEMVVIAANRRPLPEEVRALVLAARRLMTTVCGNAHWRNPPLALEQHASAVEAALAPFKEESQA